MIVATRRIEVEWGHCDPAGIVFNPRFFEWFDACTAGLFAHVGLRKHEMIARFAFTGFPIVESRAKFLKPAKFGDIVVIESSVLEFRRSSFDVRHQLRNDGALSVEAFETRVWVGPHPDEPGRLKSRPIPDEVLARFRDG